MSSDALQLKTDEQLMKLYQNGDELAFSTLYERHSARIYGYLSKRINQPEKVAEIYQEVFIKIHKSKNLYQENLPLLPWIFTITRTVMIDELRKDKKIHTVEIDELENLVTKDVEAKPDITNLLGQLPEQQKQALELRYINDQTFDQIAASLKTSPINARQIISRGLKRLRELVSQGVNHE